ncbi:ribulose bisphosphate carboxylase, type III [Methanohalobium evestigatum Z-7303]|uniref:Ribulose bisphosphate carboxylase n=1 Tax=Methanohalobium evestigatum (strain ATCC BAA-1072 / DSM 3721 / NBRC 107634 / OCM 161 / Z-7303) TaxID=644295 RepID=D7E762_METEZ|nr:type III ribulose-bisphosphate carboxylase [Methanohalobium evestigatum]ADI73811.1 ribulose bisphosphate carboxylase, type III [Methanohalobium evestigatum Z-7303]
MREDYIETEYKPKPDELVCEYYMEPADGVSFEKACNHMAGESSIDTWSDISTLSPEKAQELKPHVFSIDKERGVVKVAYKQDLFEIDSVPQILSAIAGNIMSMKLVKNLRLEDIAFPKDVLNSFRGPKYGLNGVRDLFGVYDRPLVGTIVKPKVGLSSEKHADVAYKSFVGGCDIVKDDENLTNQKFNAFDKRVKITLDAKEKAEKETGERKMYLCNITAPTCEEMLRRAEVINDLGGKYVMIDIITAGWSALQSLREATEDMDIAIHAHRCMHSVMTRNPRHGVNMVALAKLTRLIGHDQLHIGTVVGKMHGDKDEVLSLRDECALDYMPANDQLHILEQDWGNIKPMMPVASGGLEPGMIPDLYNMFGKDVIMQFGAGIHAHPMGTEAGATACRQSVEAALENITLEEYASNHKELQSALEKWG